MNIQDVSKKISMFHYFNYFSYKEYVLILLWFSFWLSLGATPNITEIHSTLDAISLIRWSFPILSALCSLIFIATSKNKLEVPVWICLLAFTFVSIFISSLLNGAKIENIYYPVASLSALSLSLAVICCVTDIQKRFIISFLPGVVMVTLAVAFFTTQTVITGSKVGWFTGYIISSEFKTTFLGDASPLPTGLARSAFLVFLFCMYGYWKNFFGEELTAILSGICLALVVYFQSRGVFVAGFSCLFIFFLLKKPTSPLKTKPLAIALGMLVLTLLALYFSAYFAYHLMYSDTGKEAVSHLRQIRDFTPNSISSGRFENWLTAIDLIVLKPLLGWGSQADRLFVGQNISSLPLYAMLCGGAAALTPLAVLGFLFLKRLQEYLKTEKVWSAETQISSLIILFIGFRGAVENSFSVYSIDFLTILPAFAYFFKKTTIVSDR